MQSLRYWLNLFCCMVFFSTGSAWSATFNVTNVTQFQTALNNASANNQDDTVNLASRVEQAAPVGGVLISHDTYRQVRGVFDVAPQAPLCIKGKSEPVMTYIVLRAKARAFRMVTRGVEGIETRMASTFRPPVPSPKRMPTCEGIETT